MTCINYLHVTINRRKFDFLAGEQSAVPDQAFNVIGFQQTRNASSELPHDARATLLHCGYVHANVAGHNSVLLEFVLCAMKQFR